MVKDESEVDVLKRRVDYLQEQYVTLGRDHRDEIVANRDEPTYIEIR